MKDRRKTPVLSIVIPCWNQERYTEECVDSILKRRPECSFEVILVNNGSEDGTKELINAYQSRDPGLFQTVHLPQNLGFCGGTNAGLKLAGGHPMWLNNDTIVVQNGFFDQMLRTLHKITSAGAVGPISNYVMGPQGIREHLRYNQRPQHPARYLVGFCMLVRREVFQKVGLIDPVFQNYGCDDLDYSIRIQEEGWELAVDRDAFLFHHPSISNTAMKEAHGGFQKRLDFGRELLGRKWGVPRCEKLFLPIGLGGARVLYAVPSWESVDPIAYANHMGFLWELWQHAQDAGFEVSPRVMPRSETCRARCEIAEQALREEFTHLFFLDDDMLANGHLNMARLLSHARPMVSGLCHLRTPPHYPSMFMDFGDKNGEVRYITDWPENALIEVDAVGMACVLIETAVLKHVKEWLHQQGRGKEALFSVGPARLGSKAVGEDIHFCQKVRDSGIPIYVDTSVKFQHLGGRVFLDEQQFKQYRDGCRQRGEPFAGYPHSGVYPQGHRPGQAEGGGDQGSNGLAVQPLPYEDRPAPEPESQTLVVHAEK